MRVRRHVFGSTTLLASVSAGVGWSQSGSISGAIFAALVPIDQVGYRYVDTGAIELTTGDVTLSLSRGEFRIIDG